MPVNSLRRSAAKALLIALAVLALVSACVHWREGNHGSHPETNPRYLVGELGGMKVNIPRYYVELVEYEGDPGWSGKRDAPKPIRTHQSRINSFGVTVRYPDMAGLSSSAMRADKRQYTSANTPWISVGFISGSIYPGDGFLDRMAKYVIDSDARHSSDVFKREALDLYGGLDLYVQQGTTINGRPRREIESDVYIHQDGDGRVKAYIDCSNAKFPGVLCLHAFSMESDGLKVWVKIMYRRSMLVHWQDLQERVRRLILSWRAVETSPPAPSAASVP
ncbi:hypothetical protein WNB94_12180 [Aquabacterium sp. A3]|uniref:hypothetical protein n=1 Tax=Aquabacterium sp. A3 TaxID=3132829 RepID=UPI00311A10F0